MYTITANPIPPLVLTVLAAWVVVTFHLAGRSRRAEQAPTGRSHPRTRETGYPTMRVRPPTVGGENQQTHADQTMRIAA